MKMMEILCRSILGLTWAFGLVLLMLMYGIYLILGPVRFFYSTILNSDERDCDKAGTKTQGSTPTFARCERHVTPAPGETFRGTASGSGPHL